MAKKMQIKKGIPVSPGYKVRKAVLLADEDYLLTRRFLSDKSKVDSEIERFHSAVTDCQEELETLKNEVSSNIGQAANIFEAHAVLLMDPSIHDQILKRIRDNQFTAEYAVQRTMKSTIKQFQNLKNEFFASRAKDLIDIEKRLIYHLLGKKRKEINQFSQEVVVVAKDLTPSQTAQFDRKNVVGFVTESGGKTSHTAIVARAMGIPAVVGLENITREVSTEDTVVIDGSKGIVILNPDEATFEKYTKLESDYMAYGRQLNIELKDLPSETRDGFDIKLMANIEVPEEVNVAVENGALGVGLYRTEFLYIQSGEIPSEDTHYRAYEKAIKQIGEYPLVIRLLDLGADKFHHLAVDQIPEKNPFLGCRSIRYLFQEFEILKAQLRAILRASTMGDLRILLPMISSMEEVRRAKQVIEDTMEELDQENIPHNKDIQVGIMIEVPSTVLIADLLAKEVDFFSIGTNDLVQYTLAVDRINERVASLYQPAHPAIVRMLASVIKVGKKNDIPVSICGEMSGEVKYIIPLIGLGLTSVSVTPALIPKIKKVIRSTTLKQANEIAREIFNFSEANDSEEFLQDKVVELVPDLFHNF